MRYPESDLYRFKGENGSMGYVTGAPYRLTIRTDKNGRIWITDPNQCPYDSPEAFWANWEEVKQPRRSLNPLAMPRQESNDIRNKLGAHFNTFTWERKMATMSDAQVLAVYFRLKKAGAIK